MELTHYNYLESILCANNTIEVSIKTKLNWYFLARAHTHTPVSILQQRMKVMSKKTLDAIHLIWHKYLFLIHDIDKSVSSISQMIYIFEFISINLRNRMKREKHRMLQWKINNKNQHSVDSTTHSVSLSIYICLGVVIFKAFACSNAFQCHILLK